MTTNDFLEMTSDKNLHSVHNMTFLSFFLSFFKGPQNLKTNVLAQ